MQESIEDVMAKYKLTEEEHKEIEQEIQRIMLHNKCPVKRPIAIIDLAPPGSGKTGLNNYGYEQFADSNVIIVNNDELKPFHPQIEEIVTKYPQYYTEVANQESDTWTSELLERALREKYNVIFEGTGRNTRILTTIKEKMQDYRVIVRGMAVNELNCLISIIERYECQIASKGWGRLLKLDYFYETYTQMPKTIQTIEQYSKIEAIEVYRRGRTPNRPVKIYSSKNRGQNRYPTATYAILDGRREDERRVHREYEGKMKMISNLLSSKTLVDDERNILEQIKKIREIYQEKNRTI